MLDNNPDRIGIWKCWFLRRGENWSTQRKTSRSKDENQQQTQPTYDAKSGNQTWATLVGGKCSHHCAIPAPPTGLKLNASFIPAVSIPLQMPHTRHKRLVQMPHGAAKDRLEQYHLFIFGLVFILHGIRSNAGQTESQLMTVPPNEVFLYSL